jgi:hypothetical protein
MENTDKTSATPDSVWEALRELIASQKETNKQMKETDERQKETDKQMKETDHQIKELKEMIGGMGNSNGMFAEEFFFNAIDNGDKKLFGEQFDNCISSSKRYNKGNRLRSERDVLLINGNSVAIIEVKYKARKEDIQKLIEKLPVFKMLYPEYKSHRIYLGLAAMAFEKDVEEDTIKEGIAIVKQVGDTVFVSNENLKVF